MTAPAPSPSTSKSTSKPVASAKSNSTNTTATPAASAPGAYAAAIATALRRIPPLWPLKHFVAVNPFLGLLDRPFPEACSLLQRITGAAPLLPPADYQAAYQAGTITAEDLAAVADAEFTVPQLQTALAKLVAHAGAPTYTGAQAAASIPLLTVADLLDQARPRAHWSVFIVEEIAKWCAITYDENQTTWNSPWKTRGLFASWREAALFDQNPEAFGLQGFRAFVASLPASAEACSEHCLRLLLPPQIAVEDFVHRQLVTLAGWAGYVQYLVREDALRGKTNPALLELLAVRLAYDAALFSAFSREGIFLPAWRSQTSLAPDAFLLTAHTRWQLAYEHGYQRALARSLAAQPAAPAATPGLRPALHAIFCIDVRSEVFRRHLEAAGPGIATTGFAGFFGFPVAHQPVAAPAGARCPVLLVPPVDTCEPQPAEALAAARTQRAAAGAWKAWQNSAASTFSFVESVGLLFAGPLGQAARPPAAPGASAPAHPACSRVAPDFTAASPATRAALAEGALRNMSLTKNFARLVLLCGHGSQSANNPYASALDCGACGGHAGDVNARLAAATLNDPAVRAELATRGIVIPADTVFIAGLHNTMTDDAVLFDLARVPASHAADLATLTTALAQAGAATRRERAPSLGLASTTTLSDAALASAIRARAQDLAQVRPEWGLANNAALIAAPRSRTAALHLRGRTFLHDYDASADPENKVLTLILCAPVVVASWINLQYYASRVDPQRYGAGNKILHNVVGGLGVIEGNSGDLKVGLPLQSIHDGEKFVHEPRRLTVYIDVARARLDAVLAGQPAVRQLFDHGWIHLIALEGPQAYRYTLDGWKPV